MTEQKVETRRPRSNRPDHGTRFSLDNISDLINDPADTKTVRIPCYYGFDPRSRESAASLWVGAYVKRRVPYSVIVANSDGSAKRAGDISRVGAEHDNTSVSGHARVLVRPEDLIIVSIRSFSSQTTMIFKVTRFERTGHDRRVVALCETVEVIRTDSFGEERVYKHDLDGKYTKDIPESTYDHILVTAKNSTKPPVNWWKHNIEHLTPLSYRRSQDVDFSTTVEAKETTPVQNLFEKLKETCVEFHRVVYQKYKAGELTKESIPNHRTPIRVAYNVMLVRDEDAKDLTKVVININVPYVESIQTEVTFSTYAYLREEPLLLQETTSFSDLIKKVLAGPNEVIVSDFSVRL